MKKICTYFLILALMVSNSMVCFAEETASTQIQQVNDGTAIHTKKEIGTTIDASIASEGTITVPKKISFSGNNEVIYNINAEGSIAGNQKLIIKFDESITLTQEGKESITCNVANVTEDGFNYFVDSEYNGTVSGISANAPKLGSSESISLKISPQGNLSAGIWNSTLNITISLESVN